MCKKPLAEFSPAGGFGFLWSIVERTRRWQKFFVKNPPTPLHFSPLYSIIESIEIMFGKVYLIYETDEEENHRK